MDESMKQITRAQTRAILDALDGEEVPAVLYPRGWVERVEAIDRGEAVPGDWAEEKKGAA